MSASVPIRAVLGRVPPGRALEGLAGGAVAGAVGLALARLLAQPSAARALVVAALLVPLALSAVGHLRHVLLAVVLVDIPLQFDVNLFYRDDAADLGAIGGLGVSATTLALTGLYVIWVVETLLRREELVPARLHGAGVLGLYVASSALSAVAAADRALAGFEIAMLVQSFLLFVYLASHVRTGRDLRFCVGVLLVGVLAEGLLILAARVGLVLALPGAEARVDPSSAVGAARFGGTIGGPNAAASFFAGLLATALAVLVASSHTSLRWLAAGAVAAGGGALLLTGSRGGWLSFAISLVVFGVLGIRAGWLGARQAAVMVTVTAVAVVPFLGVASQRLSTDDAGSARSRVPLAQMAVDMTREHPFLGVGINNVAPEIRRNAGPEFSSEWLYVVHNKYLLVAAEAGVVALGAFVAFLLATIRRGLRLSRRTGMVGPLGAAVAAAVTGQMVHMTVEIFQSRPQVQLLWTLAALLVAMHAMPDGEWAR